MKIPLARVPSRVPVLLCALLILSGPLGLQLQGQDIPREGQQELQSRGLTSQEALKQAAQLGIDLSNPQQAAARARQLGLPESQIQELLRQIPQAREAPAGEMLEPTVVEDVPVIDLTKEDPLRSRAPLIREPEYFGYRLFSNIPRNFEQSAVGPVEETYRIGFSDELRLTVWGAAEFQYDLRVDREGRIYVPNVGQTTVAGKRLDNLRQELRLWLSRTYNGLITQPPTVFMDLTLTRLRPIKIFVLGEVARPGGYTIANSSSIFNALYSVGGPLTSGSLRQIHLIRDDRVVVTVDLYDYLLKGYSKEEVRLAENDYLHIPMRGKTVTLTGDVKRPAIYELREKEHLADLLEYAGGLRASAYTRRVQIKRIIPYEKRLDPSIAREVLDLPLEEVLQGKQQIALQDGDVVHILSVLDLQRNAVFISGAVKQPGSYALAEGDRLLDIIDAADGLFSSAFTGKVDIVRLKPDLTSEIIAVNLQVSSEPDPAANIELMPEDRITVYAINELLPAEFVTIQGRVKRPGIFPLHERLTVADLIFLAGGYTEGAYRTTVDLSRQRSKISNDHTQAEILSISLATTPNDTLGFDFPTDSPARTTLLRHRDILSVRRDPNFQPQKQVTLIGEMQFPGRYTLAVDNETLTHILERAGGLKPTAYPKGGRLVRNGQRVISRIDEALAGRSAADIILLDGDILTIPPRPNSVQVSGNVNLQGLIKYEEGRKVRYYLEQAGDILEDTDQILLTQATGATQRLKTRLFFFRQNPVVDDGAIILVTSKEEIRPEDRTDTKQILSESLAMVTSVLTVLLLTQGLK